jgi:helicase
MRFSASTTLVPRLAKAAINEELKAVVNRLLRPGEHGGYQPGDLAKVALLLAAETPEAFHQGARSIAGIPYMALYPVLEEAPRYLHWIGTQGLLGTVHPWCAIVAADFSRRVKWRRCQPPRGAGRLLWMCEQMATIVHAEEAVPELWNAATQRGLTSPDWTVTGRPRHSRLDDEAYRLLLHERATNTTIDLHANRTNATAAEGSVLATWTGRRYRHTPMPRGKASVDDEANGLQRAAAVFTWRATIGRPAGYTNTQRCRRSSPASAGRLIGRGRRNPVRSSYRVNRLRSSAAVTWVVRAADPCSLRTSLGRRTRWYPSR